MPQTVTITITKADEIKRAQAAMWKYGRSMDTPQVAKQVYNLEADNEDATDTLLLSDSYDKWIKEGVWITREFLTSQSYSTTTSLTWSLPSAWDSHDVALKYALRELVHNGMLADWYDDVKPDAAAAFRKKAELNKAEIKSIIYSLGVPQVQQPTPVSVTPQNDDADDNV